MNTSYKKKDSMAKKENATYLVYGFSFKRVSDADHSARKLHNLLLHAFYLLGILYCAEID